MKKYPFVEQEELKDCGVACFSMILKFYGGYMEMDDIEELFHADKNGTNAYDMVEGMKSVGFHAQGVHCSVEDLFRANIALPCIAHVALNESYAHFVVIYEIRKGRKELLIADPANKIISMKWDVFKTIYTENLILLYPERPPIHLEGKHLGWQEIKKLGKGMRGILIQSIFFSFLTLVYAILTSFSWEWMLKGLTSSLEDSYFFLLFVVLLVLLLLKNLGNFFRNKIFLWIEKKIDLLLSMDIFEKILSLSYPYYHNHTAGDILSRIQSLENIKKAISKWLLVLMVDMPLMIVSFFLLYLLSMPLSMAALLFFFLELLLLKLFASPLEEKIGECETENSLLSTLEVEGLQSFETIKGISLENYFRKKWIRGRTFFLNKIHSLGDLLVLENFLKTFLEESSNLFLLLLGCLLVRKDQLSFGTLLTFQNLAQYFFTPVHELVDLDSVTKQAKKSLERISVFERKQQEKGFIKTMESGKIQIQNLSFSYRPDREILHHLSLTIKEREKVMVLGPSGSGKSTLFKLLKRYYEVERNQIKIGEYDILDYENLDKISYIHQTEHLYTGSLLENLQLSEKVDETFFEKIIHLCKVDEIASKNQLGYQQLIEEDGRNLSGGERQRIVLARTLLRPFQILIIDEGLNQLDANLERTILKGIIPLFANQTIIVISHRDENVDLFDRKIYLEKGKIKEDVRKCVKNY